MMSQINQNFVLGQVCNRYVNICWIVFCFENDFYHVFSLGMYITNMKSFLAVAQSKFLNKKFLSTRGSNLRISSFTSHSVIDFNHRLKCCRGFKTNYYCADRDSNAKVTAFDQNANSLKKNSVAVFFWCHYKIQIIYFQ